MQNCLKTDKQQKIIFSPSLAKREYIRYVVI